MAVAGCAAPTAQSAASHAGAVRTSAPRVGQPPASHAASDTPATAGPAATSQSGQGTPSPGPDPAARVDSTTIGGVIPLVRGEYVDAPDGSPRYVISLSSSGRYDIKGTAEFIYQDGRVSDIGQYTATLASRTLASSGKLVFAFPGGRTLTGVFAGGAFSLDGCAVIFTWATYRGGCTFTYHGSVA
ncbi:MAG TPA: hypothetical protein VGH27_23070 [Streptosporangiaceae bacterium]